MFDINIEAKYNDGIIDVRIKANKQGGDKKSNFFMKNMTLSPLPRVISGKMIFQENLFKRTQVEWRAG